MATNLNALKPTTDIQTVAAFVNQQAANGMARIAPEIFYSKQLLDTIRLGADEFPYLRYCEASPIEDRADKLYIRRWAALEGHTTPLAEGVPPQADKGSVMKYELDAKQYGRYMEFTDKVDFKIVDPVIAHYSAEYSIVAVETLDLLARNAFMLSAQKFYAKGALGADGFNFTAGATDGKPNMTDLRKIALSMKNALVKPRSNGKYHVIAGPDFFYDMISDPTVEKFMTINNTTKTMYEDSMLIPMFGLEFYETLVCPISGEYTDYAGKKRLKIWATANKAVGNSTGATTNVIDLTEGAYVAQSDKYNKDRMTGQDASYIPDRALWVIPNGYKEFKMMHVLVLGKDAMLRTGLRGEDSAKMYVKGLGSAGVLDPIDQRQSIGFKINSVGFGSTRPEAIVDYVCVPSMLNETSIYDFEYPAPAAVADPTANPNGGEVAADSTVALASTTTGAAIYYTFGATSNPLTDADAELYASDNKPTITAETLVLKFIAVHPGMANSAVVTKTFTLAT